MKIIVEYKTYVAQIEGVENILNYPDFVVLQMHSGDEEWINHRRIRRLIVSKQVGNVVE